MEDAGASRKTIDRIADVIREAARPQAVILFGSRARGTATPGSDLDILVVEDDVRDRAAEMVRLRRLLSPLRVSVDLIVVSAAIFRRQAQIPGSYLHEAATEGRFLVGSA